MSGMRATIGLAVLLLIPILFLIIAGCTSVEQKDCEAFEEKDWRERDICYQEKAIEHAVKGEKELALAECRKIKGSMAVFVRGAPTRNICFAAIAEQLKDEEICKKEIEQNTLLGIGKDLVKDSCIQRAEPIPPACPQIAVMLAALLFSSFLFRQQSKQARDSSSE